MHTNSTETYPIRVAIIEACIPLFDSLNTYCSIKSQGSAGMAAAVALSNHPAKFSVTLFDKQDLCGGMATSSPIDAHKFGASYINDGVQGGSPQFYNTYKFFELVGFKSTEIGMQISFGKGPENFWTNVFPSKLRENIKNFGRTLKIIKMLEPLFAVMSVQAMLKLFRFPKDFGDRLIYPLIALFMGTGNQTPHVSSAILERLFLDPSMSLFEYSPESLLAQIPQMRAFPELGAVYAAWRARLEERGVRVRLSTEVTRVVQRKTRAVVLQYQSHGDLARGRDAVEAVEVVNETEEFDEMIMATDADTALKILGGEASWKERKILGNVKYFWDVSVTHHDKAYMTKYYELGYREELAADTHLGREAGEPRQGNNVASAELKFDPLYFIHTYEHDPTKIEMSFDLSNYQPQFQGGEVKATDGSAAPHVYQTIFLNKDLSSEWTQADIDPATVIMEKWWKQQGHNWTHYLGTVPWLWTINGNNHTRFAGGWGLVNMHEVGITSGFAAAYQLGADYPFNDDDEARRLFTLVLGLQHMMRMRREDRRGFFS